MISRQPLWLALSSVHFLRGQLFSMECNELARWWGDSGKVWQCSSERLMLGGRQRECVHDTILGGTIFAIDILCCLLYDRFCSFCSFVISGFFADEGFSQNCLSFSSLGLHLPFPLQYLSVFYSLCTDSNWWGISDKTGMSMAYQKGVSTAGSVFVNLVWGHSCLYLTNTLITRMHKGWAEARTWIMTVAALSSKG